MHKITKSRSNPNKFSILVNSYTPKVPFILNRSLSNKKAFLNNLTGSPCKQSAKKIQTKISIKNVNFSLYVQNNLPINSPHTMRSLHNKSGGQSAKMMPQKNKFFKANTQISKNISKIEEIMNKTVQKKSFNKFQFDPLKVISKGQYGNLYLAVHRELKIIVVLKSFIKSKVTLQFMIDEFKIQLYCKHPNILPGYGFFASKNQFYLIMEAGSHNLYKIIKQNGFLSEQKSANYILQVLRGLSYLHLNGIIHRDLKPENIIVCGGDLLKISDFGWSIITENQRKTFCGTLDYVSPEVCAGRPYDNKIDCWSVGVLAYELMTGFPPFQQGKVKGSRPALDYSQKIKFPNRISKLGQKFVLKMLSPNSQDRPSALAAMNDLWITTFNFENNTFNNDF